MLSALYRGRVRHERVEPHKHAFGHRVNFTYIDLAELPTLFRKRWLWSVEKFNLLSFRRSDYLGDAEQPLREAVLDRVEESLDRRPTGNVGLLTQLRTLGYLFNPVSFYFCHDERGEIDAIVAEITNTPWRERHAYVLDCADAANLETDESGEEQFVFRFDKQFHVSPFFGLDQVYEWRFSKPGKQLSVSMTNIEQGKRVFYAGFSFKRVPISGWSLATAAICYPLQPLRLHLAIYWQAARLYLKRTPFFAHPTVRESTQEAQIS